MKDTPTPGNRPLTLSMPADPLFVGSYVRVPVTIVAGSGLSFDDLDFIIPAGLAGGVVSPCRDQTFDPTHPHIMLCAGYAPGAYLLQAVKRGTSTIVAQDRFSVNIVWKDEDTGPPVWFRNVLKGFTPQSAWGGGPLFPQNMHVYSGFGTRRLAILLVDTIDRFTRPTRQSCKVSETSGWAVGTEERVRTYYQEISYQNLDFTAQVAGPVHLDDPFDTYFSNLNGKPGDGWACDNYIHACITKADHLLDFSQIDTLICVLQPVDSPVPKVAHPQANRLLVKNEEGDMTLGLISMTNGAAGNFLEERTRTLCHEVGHTRGLPDLYKPEVGERNIHDWDIMSHPTYLPHLSLPHRMMLGWIPPNWLKTFNFQTATPVDQVVYLSPIERGEPPASHHVGIEVRLSDG